MLLINLDLFVDSILVLMDWRFKQDRDEWVEFPILRFHPCFNGLAIQTFYPNEFEYVDCRFHPCFNGLAIQTKDGVFLDVELPYVSILVLMDWRFKP